MRHRSPNYRLLKKHRSYTVGEIAEKLGVHRQTVRRWTRQGLAPIDSYKPMLILGEHAAQFLKQRKKANKKSCKLNELYCVKCREPKIPAESMAELEVINSTIGNLLGICPDCESYMNKRVSLKKLTEIYAVLDVSIPMELRHIVDC